MILGLIVVAALIGVLVIQRKKARSQSSPQSTKYRRCRRSSQTRLSPHRA
jgi:hypothetical protein